MTNLITAAQVFAAICMMENPTDIRGVHPDGVSYGVAGITQPCLNLANEILRTDWSLADMDNRTKSYKVFKAYTKRMCSSYGWSFLAENMLRVWHPGDQDYVDRGLALATTFKR